MNDRTGSEQALVWIWNFQIAGLVLSIEWAINSEQVLNEQNSTSSQNELPSEIRLLHQN